MHFLLSAVLSQKSWLPGVPRQRVLPLISTPLTLPRIMMNRTRRRMFLPTSDDEPQGRKARPRAPQGTGRNDTPRLCHPPGITSRGSIQRMRQSKASVPGACFTGKGEVALQTSSPPAMSAGDLCPFESKNSP